MALIMASATVPAVWSPGKCNNMVKRVVRFHQGADRGPTVLAQDQIAFPVARQRPILYLGGPFADGDHIGDPGLPNCGSATRLAHRPAGPQTAGQLPLQLTFSLHVKESVDGLV
jgi:hypothetical protein